MTRELTVTTINGRRVPRSKAKISVFDNAFLYADGVFETFLAIDDRVIFLEQHLDRLYRGAEVVHLQLPVERATLARWMVNTVKAHPARIKKLRLTITSGESTKWTGKQGKPQVVLSAATHSMPRKPFRLLVSEFLIDHRSIFRQIKTLSYVVNASALKRATAQGCDDALLLNTDHKVAEITTANIFWIKNGRIYTPSAKSGCLGGVTRQVIIDQARELGYRVDEVEAPLRSVVAAEEVFLTSSLKLALPISLIRQGETEYRFETGPITRLLGGHIRRMVAEG
ncbi:aminotransferase class IV [bacterium]|nr:aminotransferase class IV [bacterium]